MREHTALGFDFDRTLYVVYGDSDSYRATEYYDVARNWYSDPVMFAKGKPLPLLETLRQNLTKADIFVITARSADHGQQHLIREALATHDIFLPYEQIICLAEFKSAPAATAKRTLVETLIVRNEYLYFEYFDDKPANVESISSLNGQHGCTVEATLTTDWKSVASALHAE